MKALVTGASGFVGSTLCDELSNRGIETKVLVRHSMGNLQAKGVVPVKGDLRDADSLREAVKGVDTIFHVAGKVAAKSREDFFASNAEGTKNLVQAAREHGSGIKRFVLVSSLAAAGPSSPSEPRRENQTNAPVSFYGESKLAGELALTEASVPFETVIVRPPAVYGPRDKGILTFYQFVNKGILPILGREVPESRRYSFIHVDDLVQGILLAATQPVRGPELYYITGDGEYSWSQAMELIAKGLHKKTFPLRLPLTALHGAAGVCSALTKATGKVFPFSLDKMKEIRAAAWTCSNEKAKKELGFKPYWGLDAGLAKTAEWYRDSGWL